MLVSCTHTETLVLSNLLPICDVIFDSPITLTSRSFCTYPVVLYDTKNIGKAVVISLLSCPQAEVYRPPSWTFHFFCVPISSYNSVTIRNFVAILCTYLQLRSHHLGFSTSGFSRFTLHKNIGIPRFTIKLTFQPRFTHKILR